MVLAHGFGGTKDDVADSARTLAQDGFTVITFTARGFGASGGLIHLNHPDYEGADARRIVDLAAQRPEVLKADGDPVVGFAGASYGGALALLVAGLDQRVDAIVPAFTWNRLDQALFPQYRVTGAAESLADVTPVGGTGVFKQGWASRLFSGGGRSPNGGAAGGDPVCGRFTAALCAGYRQAAETGRVSPALVDLLAESGPDPVLADITAPTLIVAGEDDTLFPLDQADANLRGLPAEHAARLTWVAGGHDGDLSVDALLADLSGWFGRYLTEVEPTDPAFSVLVPETPLVGRGGVRDPETRVAARYPGRGVRWGSAGSGCWATRRRSWRRRAASGGADQPAGWSGALGGAAGAAGYALGVLPGQAATFTTEPVSPGGRDRQRPGRAGDHRQHDVGHPVRLAVGPRPGRRERHRGSARAGAQLGGAAAPHGRAGPAVRPESGSTEPRHSGAAGRGPPGAGRAPAAGRGGDDRPGVRPPRAVGRLLGRAGRRAGAGAARGHARGAGSRRPQRAGTADRRGVLARPGRAGRRGCGGGTAQCHPDPALADVPLVVTDVVKTYADGFRAVDGISLSRRAWPGGRAAGAEWRGQDHGHPDARRADPTRLRSRSSSTVSRCTPAPTCWPLGRLVHRGTRLPAPPHRQAEPRRVLASHRPPARRRRILDEALAIAGLGTALDRKVRGYSHGMRQRLGIAQAMLGLPICWCWTSRRTGLDPPQIKAMR